MSLSNQASQPKQNSMGHNYVAPPQSLHDLQAQFGRYLRGDKTHTNQQGGFNDLHTIAKVANCDPSNCDPTNTNIGTLSLHTQDRVTRLYQTLIFNNICGFIDKCFPVCKSLLTIDKWRYVCQQFVATHPCDSPYFTQINQSFVDYLALPDTLTRLELPPYFAKLAHYEWMALYVDIHHDSGDVLCMQSYPDCSFEAHESVATYHLKLNPTVQNLHYQWAVHSISADNRPTTPEDSFFLIYRHPTTHNVEFMQVNALTSALLAFIDNHGDAFTMPQEASALIIQFAHSIGFAKAQTLVEFGASLLGQLQHQCVLYCDVK